MRYGIIGILAAVCIFSGIGCAVTREEAAQAREPFTIVVLPDTQVYAESFPDHFRAQTKWVSENREELNVLCVLHEGDVTNRNSEKEWTVVDEAMSTLDGVVPYCIALGNHDLGPDGHAQNRDCELFAKLFPPAKFEKEPWYGGCLDGDMRNAWYPFETGGMKFLVVCIDFFPPDEVLEWASEIVEEHGDSRVIVVTHAYLGGDGLRLKGNTWECGGNDGERIWEKFVKKHENIFLVVCGHTWPNTYTKAVGDNGNTVHEVLADYQGEPEGGNGWLRLMKFVPDENRIVVETYSPVLGQFREDDKDKFEIEYDMKLEVEEKANAAH
jgi:hypothetical protein